MDKIWNTILYKIKKTWQERRTPRNTLIIYVVIVIILIFSSYIISEKILISSALVMFSYYTAESSWENTKINLFNKRMEVYKEIQDQLIKYCVDSEEYHNVEDREMWEKIYFDVKFLFGEDVVSLIEKTKEKINQIIDFSNANRSIRQEYKNINAIEPEHSNDMQVKLERNVHLQSNLILELRQLKKPIFQNFARYLNFSHIK